MANLYIYKMINKGIQGKTLFQNNNIYLLSNEEKMQIRMIQWQFLSLVILSPYVCEQTGQN